MIYTFKVHAAFAAEEPLEVTHFAHGGDVLQQARTLIDKHPDCGGVEVLLLGSRLFFVPKPEAEAGEAALA
jgi:hypothetical protein